MTTALKAYPISLAAGATRTIPLPGTYFRIQSSTGAVDVYGDQFGTMPGLQAGEGLQDVPFTGLTIINTSGAQNDLVLLIASSAFFSNRQNGTMDLTAATIAALLRGELSTAHQESTTALVANTASVVVAAAANVAGLVLLDASYTDYTPTAVLGGGLYTGTAAPTTTTSNEMIASLEVKGVGSANIYYGLRPMSRPVYIPVGQGLWWLQGSASAALIRTARWKLL